MKDGHRHGLPIVGFVVFIVTKYKHIEKKKICREEI
jgi:hypothetical protein